MTHHVVTRAKTGSIKLKLFFVSVSSPSSFIISKPINYKEVLKCPHWKLVVQNEIGALNSKRNWILVPFPNLHTYITFKWVFKVKILAYCSLDK